MREIKFRAWDEVNKVMEYNVNVNEGKPVKRGYQWFNSENTIYHAQLMQYTGLKDRNGNEIYEGDFVKNGLGEVGYVYYDEAETSFVSIFKDIDEYRYEVLGLSSPIEVIGNIYENPELVGARNGEVRGKR